MGGNSNIPKDSMKINLSELQKNIENRAAEYKEIRETEKKKKVAKELQEAVANGKISPEDVKKWENMAHEESEKFLKDAKKEIENMQLEKLENDAQNKIEKPPFNGLG